MPDPLSTRLALEALASGDLTKRSHLETLAHAREVLPTMRRLMKQSTHYVLMAGPRGTCATCGADAELRFGHCNACANTHDPEQS